MIESKSKLRERQQIERDNQLRFLKKIGQGSFGKVYEAVELKENIKVAIKKVSKRYVQSECYLLSSLEHPNIVPFKRLIEGQKAYYVVMELMEGGSLRELVTQRVLRGNPLSEEEVSIIMRQIFSAVEYMHNKSIIHRDLKTENILLMKPNDIFSVKIVDFGLSFRFQEDNSSYKLTSGRCGTFNFMAPEQLKSQQYSKPVDMWACGIILAILVNNGVHPFARSGETRENYIKELKRRSQQYELFGPYNTLLQRLLAFNPFDRYSAGQALLHPWITRRSSDLIPMNIEENRQMFVHHVKVTQFIKAMILLGYIFKQSRKVQVVSALEKNNPLVTQTDSQMTTKVEKFTIEQTIQDGDHHSLKLSQTPNKKRILHSTAYKVKHLKSPKNKFRQTILERSLIPSAALITHTNEPRSIDKVAEFRKNFATNIQPIENHETQIMRLFQQQQRIKNLPPLRQHLRNSFI